MATYTVNVRDANNTSIAATSNSFNDVAANNASANFASATGKMLNKTHFGFSCSYWGAIFPAPRSATLPTRCR
jgi:hypothetical protein